MRYNYLVAYLYKIDDGFGMGSSIIESQYAEPTSETIGEWAKALVKHNGSDEIIILSFNRLAKDKEE